MIHVIATIDLVAGQRDAFLREFHRIVPTVRAENGCLEYGPTLDVPTSIPVQIPVRENTVTVVEKWADLPALEAHLSAPHMTEYRARVKEYVAGVKLQVLRPA
ncbi:MAG: putative quinol monooxygenase [Verrucomicrobiota bacterium]